MEEEKGTGRQPVGEALKPHLQMTAINGDTPLAGQTPNEFNVKLFQRYRSTFDRANEAIFILQDGCFVFVNRKMAGLLGVPLEDLE